jgi:hypothetical protein
MLVLELEELLEVFLPNLLVILVGEFPCHTQMGQDLNPFVVQPEVVVYRQ